MDRRKFQLKQNLDWILGGYENGMLDDPDVYTQLTAPQVIEYVKLDLYDIKAHYGHCAVRKGICKDLKFLGNEYIDAEILKEAQLSGILKED